MNADQLLDSAKQRAKNSGLPYAGALTPEEAYAVLQQHPHAQLVDVRTRAEWAWVGRVSVAVEIEMMSFSTGRPNPQFVEELQQKVKKDSVVLFLCRSGARSHNAATLATQAGYAESYNILEGFEGDCDEKGHRNTVGGWRAAGLPWSQS